MVAGLVLAGCVQAPRAAPASRGVLAPIATPRPVPPTMQYLYGSAEAAAASEQAYNAMVDAVIARLRRDQARTPAAGDHFSAVLAPGTTLDNPTMIPCGNKPRAVVFDVDETILLNLGYEADDAAHPGRPYDDARWLAWERTGVNAVAAVPGALDAVKLLRAVGVTVIFNSNRTAGTAAFTVSNASCE